jgi:hypothetical protein
MQNLNGVDLETFDSNKQKFLGFQTKIRKISKQNNDVVICIPVLKAVKDVLKANNGSFPKFPTNQVLNRQLKKLCAHLEFNRVLDCKYWYYGHSEPITKTKQLHTLIEAHVMRKSFYTNLSKNQINNSVIEAITHPKAKNRNMSDIYNRTTRIENALMLLNAIKKVKSKVYCLR